jgi:hypothetical protein
VEQEEPAEWPDAETTLLHNAEHNVLLTHVIAKLEQFKDVEQEEPAEWLLAETTLLHNAELTQLATKLLLEDVEKTVTIMSNVPWTHAILQLEIAKTFQTTTDVVITTNVPLIDVLLMDVFTLSKIALTTMHVLKMFVMQPLDNALTLLLLVLQLFAKLENAMLKLDAPWLHWTVMITLHVPLTLAMITVDVFILQMINCVTIMILTQSIDVTLKRDAPTPELSVTITTLAPTISA